MTRTHLALATLLAIVSAHAHAQPMAPAPDADPSAPPPTDTTHAGVRRAMGEGPPVTEARPSDDVPSGVVRVRVLRPDGSPIERATVRLGIMAQGGNRNAKHAQTGADGFATFTGLATGQGQAYRPRVVSGGATYATTPFQLEPGRGHDCVVRVFPATRRLDSLLLVRGQAIIELRPERMHMTMQLDLANVGEETYVFPTNGLVIALPENATAFQAQESMNDQRLAMENGALHMRGSIPPGRHQMVFGYDLPYDGDTLSLTLPNPFRTIAFGVAIESTEGLTLEVEGAPPTELREADGRMYQLTQIDRTPQDPPLTRIQIDIAGIPGKGPYALIASLCAALVFAAATALGRRGNVQTSALVAARMRRKTEIVGEAARLRAERSSGEVGPEYYAKTREALITELASILAAETAKR